MIGSGVWLFATAYLVSVASAGPGVASVISRAITYGWRGIPSFILGFIAADLIWFAGAVTGVGALASSAAHVLIVLKYAGAAYLLYLAYRMWTANVRLSADVPDEPAHRLFLASFALMLGNPKPMMFFLAVVPAVVDLSRLSVVDGLAMAATIPIVLAVVLGAYVFVAVRARRFFTHGGAFRIFNRCGALMMAAAALLIVAS